MSSLEMLNKRINYNGGKKLDRMDKRKLDTLRKALFASYQSETIRNKLNQEFKCLINPDVKSIEADHKILSIPFEDIQLNSERIGKTTEGRVSTNVTPGDVIYWIEDETYWLIYLRYPEEKAYFRAEIVECNVNTITINNTEYHVYFKGPSVKNIDWNTNTDNNVIFNDLNYDGMMFITKDENTLDFIKRFNKIKFDNKNWEIQAKNIYNADGIIILYLKEYYTTKYTDEMKEETEEENTDTVYIEGGAACYPYDTVSYSIVGDSGGQWSVNNKNIKINKIDDTHIELDILVSKSCIFELKYKNNDIEVTRNIQVKSL